MESLSILITPCTTYNNKNSNIIHIDYDNTSRHEAYHFFKPDYEEVLRKRRK